MNLSVIIPARNEPYLQNTIDDLFAKARTKIEIIVILDGYWPAEPLKIHSNLIQIHRSKPRGMRDAINSGVQIASGDFIMKCDAHCAFAKGFDRVLSASCASNWTVVPRRFGLDVDNWTRSKKMYEFQYIRKHDLKGKDWPEYADRVKGQHITDLMTTQGSCWFMHREYFNELGGLDIENYGSMGKEAQEVCLKTWLSGGRFVLNRDTWYAHWRKNRGMYRDVADEKRKSSKHVVDFWKSENTGYKHSLQWLVDKFAPIPTWTEPPTNCPTFNEVRMKKDIKRSINVIKMEGMNRPGLYQHFAKLGFKVGAEVGVQRGRNAWIMLETIPDLKLFLIDPYKDNFDTLRQWGQKWHSKARRIAHNRVRNRPVEFIEATSVNASIQIPDESLDFVYIDGDHSYDYVMMDIQLWSRKVRKGGIVSGHDYHYVKSRKFKVTGAVNDYAAAHKLTIYITDEKIKEVAGDGYASWFWVK